MPPARITASALCTRESHAIITVFRPEPHILLTVVAPTLSGKPAARTA